MKISELIPMLNSLLSEVGDAEVCVKFNDDTPQEIGSVFTARNVTAPTTEETKNIVVLKAASD